MPLDDILKHFYALSAVPRPSGGEAPAAAHVAHTLGQLGFSSEFDAAGNLRCVIPAAPGFEAAPGVILQAHIDMVCAAKPGSPYRPGVDPIRPIHQGNLLRTDGTSSLGADNGMAVAIMLALAQNPPPCRGKLMLLFTVSEEVGLIGAKALDPNWLQGFSLYINLDGFSGDIAICASAGGLRRSWSHPLWQADAGDGAWFSLLLAGLTGGHSGFDIHRGRLNAVVALCAFLQANPCAVGELNGGSDFNAIPTQAQALVCPEDGASFARAVDAWAAELRQSHGASDPGLTVCLAAADAPKFQWTAQTRSDVLGFTAALPCGPTAFAPDGSTADSGNPASIVSEENQITLCHFGRFAARSALEQAEESAGRSAKRFCFTEVESARYAPWERAEQTLLAQQVSRAYKTVCGAAPRFAGVHVGLECSVLLDKAPWLTGIALGCNISNAHSVSETVDLDSAARLEELLPTLLAIIAKEKTV